MDILAPARRHAGLANNESEEAQWAPFFDELENRLHRVAGLLRGEDVALGKPQALLPEGEEQGQATRLRQQVEVLEKSALGVGPLPRS